MEIILYFSLFLLIVVILIINFTKSLRKAVLLSAVMSIISSLVYLLLLSPDVALAEAVIGCSISTIILLTAIKHLNIINVVYQTENINQDRLSEQFKKIFNKEDYDIHFFSNSEEFSTNLEKYDHIDYYIHEKDKEILFYANEKNENYIAVKKVISQSSDKKIIEVLELDYEK
ncbi:MAG: DUF4040 domain-containing protein [Tissierellia bacterium]|nr:DUF4040 domain-containing protein [Tissierellia bacterium]